MRKEEKKEQSLRAKFYQVSSFYHSVMEVNMREDSESRRLRLFFFQANEYSNGGENISALIIDIPRHAIIRRDKQSRGF